MINYIIKCFSSSFVKTLGRILAYISIGIIILVLGSYINIADVHATIGQYWAINRHFDGNITYYNNSVVSNAIGSTENDTFDTINCNVNSLDGSCYLGSNASFGPEEYISYRVPYQQMSAKANSTFGIGVNYSFIKNQLYFINYYVCAADSYFNEWESSAGSLDDTVGGEKKYLIYDYITLSTLSATPFKTKYSSCRLYSQALSFNSNVAWSSIRFKSTVNQNIYVYGVEVEPGGMFSTYTNGDIVNHIKQIQSGVADTNSKLEQVDKNISNAQNSINNNISKTEQSINNNVDEMKAKQDETNDYLKDDTAPSSDISSLGNVQGLLPPGPVDSLLNIPFKFLSVLTSSMSGTCVPVSGKFVFDSTLTLPCFSELIWDNNSVPNDLLNWLSLIPGAFILIKYFKHLYKKVDRAVSMETTSDDEWGVI